MPVDPDYVKSMEQWFANMELNILHTLNDIQFHEKEMELHTKQLETCREQLVWDESRLDAARADYARYLEINK